DAGAAAQRGEGDGDAGDRDAVGVGHGGHERVGESGGNGGALAAAGGGGDRAGGGDRHRHRGRRLRPVLEVRRTLVCVAPHLVAIGRDDGGVTADRHAAAKQVAGGAVGGGQFLLLAPGGARAHEHVRRTLVGVAPHLVEVGPDHGGVAADRHAAAKLIV